MRRLLIICGLLIGVSFANAQELNCTVQVSSLKITGNNQDVFTAMQQKIFEFMNTTKWTKDVFAQKEKIEMNILINLTNQVSTDQFQGLSK